MRSVLPFLALLTSLNLPAQDCVLKKEKDGIRIYSCPVAGSAIMALRVTFTVTATIEEYVTLVTDIDTYKHWRYRETNHKLLKRISDHEFIYYTQISAPFPVSDRDLVAHVTIQMDSVTQVLTIITEAMPDYQPQEDGFVRIPKSKTSMKLTPQQDGKLKADCFIETDPGGQIPAWVINMVSTTNPYETFKSMIQRIENR